MRAWADRPLIHADRLAIAHGGIMAPGTGAAVGLAGARRLQQAGAPAGGRLPCCASLVVLPGGTPRPADPAAFEACIGFSIREVADVFNPL